MHRLTKSIQDVLQLVFFFFLPKHYANTCILQRSSELLQMEKGICSAVCGKIGYCDNLRCLNKRHRKNVLQSCLICKVRNILPDRKVYCLCPQHVIVESIWFCSCSCIYSSVTLLQYVYSLCLHNSSSVYYFDTCSTV